MAVTVSHYHISVIIFSYFNFVLVLQPEKKIFNGKLLINFNFLPNTDAI